MSPLFLPKRLNPFIRNHTSPNCKIVYETGHGKGKKKKRGDMGKGTDQRRLKRLDN